MNRIVHFEIHSSDPDRAQKFYEEVFGWGIQSAGPQFGGYRLITTGPAGQAVNGGLLQRQGAAPQGGEPVNAFVCTIQVDDIDATLERIQKAGGAHATDKMNIPGVGTLAYRKDPDGNIFGVLQPK